MACLKLDSGSDVKIFFTPLLPGNCSKPIEGTLTTGATSTPADGDAATITLASAVPANIVLPKGMWLAFEDPLTGNTVLVQLASTVTSGSSLPVNNVPKAIAANSVCKVPSPFNLRESANLGRSGNSEDIELLGEFWARSITSGASWDVSADGFFSQTDSSYLNAEYCFLNNQNGWVTIEMPNPDPLAYSKGTIYEGEVSIESMPIEIGKSSIKGNISLKGNGKLYKIDPKVSAAIVP